MIREILHGIAVKNGFEKIADGLYCDARFILKYIQGENDDVYKCIVQLYRLDEMLPPIYDITYTKDGGLLIVRADGKTFTAKKVEERELESILNSRINLAIGYLTRKYDVRKEILKRLYNPRNYTGINGVYVERGFNTLRVYRNTLFYPHLLNENFDPYALSEEISFDVDVLWDKIVVEASISPPNLFSKSKSRSFEITVSSLKEVCSEKVFDEILEKHEIYSRVLLG